MTPSSFTFKLTVPRDPALAAVVTGVAAHAVTYAEMDQPAGAEFVKKVAEVSALELGAGGVSSCPVVVTSADGELLLTIGVHAVSQKISA